MSDRPDQRQERASSRQSSSGHSSHSGRPGWRRDAFLQAGFLIGAALGAAATVMGRRMERSARRGLIDWRVAERIAVDRVRNSQGTLTPHDLAAAEPVYAVAMREIVPALGAALGTELPGIVERSAVVAREDWVRANVATFAGLIGKIEGDLLDQVLPPGSGFVKASMAIANRAVSTRQFGYLLGFLGQRVLGQYDLAILSAESTPGRLLFLDENIRRTAASLSVPLNPFRTWIALHESTHAFEFEAHPWLRPYLAERLERQLTSLSSGVSLLRQEPARALDGGVDGRGAAARVP
jgi:putative hydrolase